MPNIFVPMIVADALAAFLEGKDFSCLMIALLALRAVWSFTLLIRRRRLLRSTLTTKAALFCLPTARSLSQCPSS